MDTNKKAQPFQPKGDVRQVSHILIRAEDAVEHEPGVFRLVLHTRPVTEQEQEVLRRLFPNTQHQIGVMLNMESLISSMIIE